MLSSIVGEWFLRATTLSYPPVISPNIDMSLKTKIFTLRQKLNMSVVFCTCGDSIPALICVLGFNP